MPEKQPLYGDIMRQAPVCVYTRAGIARRSGKGMALALGDQTFYVMPDEMAGLAAGQNAAVVNHEGEQEGTAWLSPVFAGKKKDLVALVQDRLFVVSWKEMQALCSGSRNGIPVREYLARGPERYGGHPAQ